MSFLFLAIQAVIMIFQLRSLLQSSNVDYYHPMTQSIIKLTDKSLKILPKRNIYLGPISMDGFIFSLVFCALSWIVLFFIFGFSMRDMVMLGLTMYIKSLGYLIIALLLAQALTSWLPSTRALSFYFGQITAIITAPVQKIIPPIGMIDISLMVVLIAIFTLNRLCASIFGLYWFAF